MNNIALQNALDRAITKVARGEFNRLRKKLSRFDTAQEVEDALKSLDRLRRGDMPEYDAWDALFYVTWYQPSQINLAYSIMTEMQDKDVTLDDKLHIVDFGCGALAMQFAVALAIADALEQGQSVSKIRIELIDDSEHMVRLGKKIWRQFQIEVNKESSLSHLAEACKIIKHRRNTSASVKRQEWANTCWVSAIHAVYEENKVAVKQELDILVNNLNPDVCFTTTNKMGGHGQSLLSALWDADNSRYYDWAWNEQPSLQLNS